MNGRVVMYSLIPGYPGYRVGDDGSMWTRWAHNGHQPRRLGETWRQMKPAPNRDGYPIVGLYRDGKARRVRVHHLVLEAFVGPRPTGLEACHNNGDPGDCRASNLRWDTHVANQLDRERHGTVPRGERSGNAVLTKDQVLDIKRRLLLGEAKKSIALAFGVAPSTVSAIASGRIWGWLDAA